MRVRAGIMTRLLGSVLGVALLAWAVSAEGASPRVAGFERFCSAADSSLTEAGELLAAELNCRSCHTGDKSHSGPLHTKKAPILDEVGNRVRPEWIRRYLKTPQTVKPGATMPDVLHGLSDADRSAHSEALTHYLATTGTVADTHFDQSSAERGKAAFQRVGCVACHNPQTNEATNLATSTPLPNLGEKYTSTSLATFLKDPLKVRPSGRMPGLGLKDEEYRDLAQHFLRGVKLPPNVKYAVYQGDWDKLPDFESLKPVATGECAGFDLSVAKRENNFAIRFTTNLYIKAPAQHQFYLGSDDGSRLTIGGQVIVDVDGIHPHQETKGRHSFNVGWQPVIVDYFQGGGEWTLTVDIEGNGLKKQPLAAVVSLQTSSPPTESATFTVDADLAEKGRQLFSSLGCANCHQLKQPGPPPPAGLAAKPWDELRNSAGGCLATQAPRGLPRYELSERQHQALAAVLGKSATEPKPADLVHRSLVTFNCYACHTRRDLTNEEELVMIGGVEESRNAYFDSTQKEMGDEGRIPPALTGVGDKLREEWLARVLEQGTSDRQNYMLARMPRFGRNNVGHLTAAFRAADLQPDSAPQPAFSEPEYRVKAAGRHLVGGNTLACIKCHDWGPHPSLGVRAINLAVMTKRLREDWFHRYMLNPQVYRPGTRMPAAWPFGKATFTDVLGGSVDQQIRAVWMYLGDGDKAAVPSGLVREPIELKAASTPLIYRNFIEGAGSRAIGVGYPEGANLAWDANDMRLALIWHGAFLDASRHWNGRGVGFEPPLGDDVIVLSGGQPLSRLASVNEPWPTGLARENGFHFRGYRLDKQQRPSFQYRVNDLMVDETLIPLPADGSRYPHLERTLTITGSAAQSDWFYRPVSADKIESDKAGIYRIDGIWSLKIESAQPPTLRDSNGKRELLVPLKFGDKPDVLKLTYQW